MFMCVIVFNKIFDYVRNNIKIDLRSLAKNHITNLATEASTDRP